MVFIGRSLEKHGLYAPCCALEKNPKQIKFFLLLVNDRRKLTHAAEVLASADPGMEAIYEFEIEDMPVTVAMDANGCSVHEIGSAKWRNCIGMIPVRMGKGYPTTKVKNAKMLVYNDVSLYNSIPYQEA